LQSWGAGVGETPATHTHTHTKHDRSQNTAPQQKRADQCIDSWLHAAIIHEALVVGSRDADSESFGRPLRNVDLQLVPSLWGLPLRDNERKPNIHRTDGLGVTSTKLWMFGCHGGHRLETVELKFVRKLKAQDPANPSRASRLYTPSLAGDNRNDNDMHAP
jgi:hypothetical protein